MMTTVELTAVQRQLFEKIAEQNDFKNYKISAVSGSSKGDNYLGIITSVTIEENERKLELILKSAVMGEFRNQMPIRQAYLREIYLYEKIFVKFREFQQKYGLKDPFEAYAKLYASCDTEGSECLILENLRDSSYSMWNRKTPMNPEHLTAVIKEYAKFHAVSLAMRDKISEEFDELTKNMNNIFEEFFNDDAKNLMFTKAVMANVYKVFEDDPATTDILKKFENKLPKIFAKMGQRLEEEVVDHGDCWCNNFMFVYENSQNHVVPAKVRIIDWQISKLGSPAMDLVYFFLVNSSRETLFNYEDYLKIYYDTLCTNLQQFSCQPEVIFSYNTLLRHWNDRIEIGIYTAFNLIKMTLCDSDEAPDFAQMDDSKNIMDMIGFKSRDAELYNRRIRDLVEFCIAKGFL